jgi:hypothetical protein
VSTNSKLVLELSEKLTIKHLVANENDYSLLISNLFIVANNQLKIEKTTEYLVSDVHSTRGFFAYEDQLDVAVKPISENL